MSPSEKKHVYLGHATERLKHMAQELNIAVLEVSAVKNSSDPKTGKVSRPVEGMCAECSEIERKADKVIYLYSENKSEPRKREAIITKNRDGEKTDIPLEFEGAFARFVDPATVPNRDFIADRWGSE
jgi:replicative DNA helicase